ncbi:hypothetical protein SAMN02745823_00846 [Sporobacter termitidis DSM 10068]|uniref:Uncharacterized protein n=1 Tax=Sporobacter termitidis DSM 10068 TaxID=1123282 RepID=A0A1M5VIW7_9FIRM|nr:hypothetical protein [Sporobacter termitidis]SHH75014.1 hypothetical protein SAMN02745823_00846 [Sporobacter termitidis DSM 10068]
MAIVSFAAIIVFDIVLCIVEIPKMISQKLIKEFVTFSVLLLVGTTIAVLKCLNINVPNPSEWQEWFFSPVADLMKSLLKP